MNHTTVIKLLKGAASAAALFAALLLANLYTNDVRYDVFKCEFYNKDWHYIMNGLTIRAECN